MRILLVKLSSLGDVVHTLPVVQDILTALPAAQIDWVVEQAFASLLKEVGGLNKIIPCKLRQWRKSPLSPTTRNEWRNFKAELQHSAYDAVIDLQGLTKSAVIARLAKLTPQGRRFAMANQTDGSAYEAPTRWLAHVAIEVQPHIHAVQRGREVAARALGYSLPSAVSYPLKVPAAQSIRALAAPEIIALIHGTSRAEKEWSIQNWVSLGLRLHAAGYQTAMVHGSASELATSQAIAAQTGAAVWPMMPLDALTRELTQCTGAIGVDSGVSHIAVALGLPHVQIYNFDTAWRTGPPANLDPSSGDQLSVFAQPSPTVDLVWTAWQQCEAQAIRKSSGSLQ
jgi:heptosyltransferase I